MLKMKVFIKRPTPLQLWVGPVCIALMTLLLSHLGSVMRTEPAQPVYPDPEPNPYTAQAFAFSQTGWPELSPEGSRLGIDVSGFQGEIDWQQVKDSGVSFVFIRVGGRGYGEEGRLYTDDWAQTYYEGARKAGLQVGAYFFSQAITPAEATQEASFALRQIKGWEMDLPLVFDWEYVSESARTARMDADTLTACALAFCQRAELSGVTPMLYFNASQSRDMLHLEQLTAYPFWLAMYDSPMDYPYRVSYWQYSCEGTVPGIETPVDMNLYLP